MLAQNFKSAEELRLSDEEYAAFIKTLVLMETGKIEYYDIESTSTDYWNENYVPLGERPFTGHFNICQWNVNHSCGTVACIGGTIELVGNLKFGSLDRTLRNQALRQLFYPSYMNDHTITVEHAAQALRNFLTTGWPKWHEVMA